MEDIDATTPLIREHPSRDGVQLVDPIQNVQFTLLTGDSVEPVPCDTDRFYFPIDTASTLATDVVETPYQVGAWIRNGAGEIVAEPETEDEITLPDDRYFVELMSTGIKVELSLDGRLVVEGVADRVRFRVESGGPIHVGMRSLHEQPAATVTTTDDPEDVMAAVSTLGSALKTTSCERSFPTLRGHPPLFERGEKLSIPSGVESPDTGIKIEVPADLEYVYPLAPLAYYLGATVERGTTPRIIADDWDYTLSQSVQFEDTVARVLKQVFLLDCVTRTEGYYDVDLHERKLLEKDVNLDFASLYGRELAERVRQYLGVPWNSLIEPMPKWKLTADVQPDPEYVRTLPFLANELAVIRCREEVSDSPTGDNREEAHTLLHQEVTEPVRGNAARTRTSTSTSQTSRRLVHPSPVESIEHAYIGDGIPFRASKMAPQAYERRLDFEPSRDQRINVTVVCNDEQMAEENVVSEIYGTREWIEFETTFEDELTIQELRETIQTDIDFLHYIGHVDDNGIQCVDGYLDARNLSTVNVSAFILNACDSYDQGRALVDQGAMAGIVTLSNVNIDKATSVGRTVARLLNQGFSLAATMSIVEPYEDIGHHYLVVGDGSLSVVSNESGTPYCVELDIRQDQRYELNLFGYPRLDSPLGTIFTPYIEKIDSHFLNSGHMGSVVLDADELTKFFDKQEIPVIHENDLTWSKDFLAQI